MKKEVILIHRKQFPHTFSIEFIFDELKSLLQPSQKVTKFILPKYSNSVVNRLLNLIAMLRLRHKIVHVTGDVHYAILGSWFSLRVLTIHDLAFMHQNNGAKRSFLKWFYIILPVRFAHKVVVVSKATAINLSQYIKVDSSKISVIPDFISDVYQPVPNRKFNSSQPNILQIGTAFNKNIDRLAEAISGISCTLIIIGKLDEEQKAALHKFNISYLNKIGLSETELIQEYKHADLLTFVSTIEGFGMPILEAQACGLPVITSNCTSMPEVAGDAALFVDPLEVTSIRNRILTLINDENLRNNLVEKGFKNVKRFSKDEVAAQYAALYQEL